VLERPLKRNIAFVSTALPPSASGQAKVLERLIRTRPDCIFWFLSDNLTTFTQRPGEGYGHYLRLSAPKPPRIGGELSGAIGAFNNRLGYQRAVKDRAVEIEGLLRGSQGLAVVGCSGNPFDLAAAAIAARKISAPFFAYLFDDPVFQWPQGPLRNLAIQLEPAWSRQAKAVICPNEILANEYAKRTGRPAVVVRNPIDDDAMLETAPAPRQASTGPVRILYSGSVYHAQGDAFANLTQAMARTPGRYRLDVYTSQPPEALANNGLHGPDVVRHDHVGGAEIAEIQRTSDILFLPLAFNSTIQDVLMSSSPGKMAEYLTSGRPVLVHAPAGSFVSEFFRKTGAGYVVDQPSVDELARGLQVLASDGDLCARFAAAARSAAREFSQAESRRRFWRLIDGVAERTE